MRITCLIIGKDRHISTVKVDARKANFTHNNGLYTIPKEAVNLTEFDDGKTESYPELIYMEGEALPVNNSESDVSGFLAETVLTNFLKQVAQPKSDWMNVIFDYLHNPNKLLMVAFVLIIVLAAVGGLLSG